MGRLGCVVAKMVLIHNFLHGRGVAMRHVHFCARCGLVQLDLPPCWIQQILGDCMASCAEWGITPVRDLNLCVGALPCLPCCRGCHLRLRNVVPSAVPVVVPTILLGTFGFLRRSPSGQGFHMATGSLNACQPHCLAGTMTRQLREITAASVPNLMEVGVL